MSSSSNRNTQTPHVTIIGSGVGGICMAMQLERAGIKSYELVEKPMTLAARGATTHIRVARATFHRTFIPILLKGVPTGLAHFPNAAKYSPICPASPKNTDFTKKPVSTRKSSRQNMTIHAPNGSWKPPPVRFWKPILW